MAACRTAGLARRGQAALAGVVTQSVGRCSAVEVEMQYDVKSADAQQLYCYVYVGEKGSGASEAQVKLP
jgi:hypothetical protein